jgi:ribosome maturation factor RimP
MNVSEILDAIGSEIVARNCFLVDISVSKDNDIVLTIESENGKIELEDCVSLSRFFESKFDREVEDYSLTVSSAGLDQPFKVLDQYIKFIGSEVEVVVKGGGKMKGVLTSAAEEGFEVTVSKMVKVEGSKKKVQQDTVTAFTYDGIKSCKPVIKFK